MQSNQSVTNGHRRASSSSTVRVAASVKNVSLANETLATILPAQGSLWVHDDAFSTEEILINPSILSGSRITEGSLVEVASQAESTDVLDFEENGAGSNDEKPFKNDDGHVTLASTLTCLCIVKLATSELLTKHPGLEISITKSIAETFNLRSRTCVILKPASFDKWTASHVEISFRDAYLARSDMWRLVSQELANKVVFRGQKISFLGAMKLTIKEVHVRGHRASTGYFSGTTVPVFRSEAARYVLFVQMSREMWDFDAEGNGEIMFNRVINGFLPDLFRRWAELEVRHLVSIVMFGRMEYDRYDFGDTGTAATADRFSQTSSTSNAGPTFHQDFFRVVVTDMASAQWTTILNELKKDFQVFLRDVSLHKPVSLLPEKDPKAAVPKITGRPSTALKGNILEAINLASSQFANDYIDRDLIRTGVSTVIITAGTGVFDVDRDLLNLTSENLTNNGIGIDVVCLSTMPLHSVPLFRYRLPQSTMLSRVDSRVSTDTHELGRSITHTSAPVTDHSSALSSFTGTSATYFTRFPSAFPSKFPQHYGYGIPHWVDLSYWSSSNDNMTKYSRTSSKTKGYGHAVQKGPFIPRVRMYELQMMGLMELGMADISIPYIVETALRQKRPQHQSSADFTQLPTARNPSQSPSYFRKTSALSTRQRDGPSLPSHQPHPAHTAFDQMDEYDELIFLDVNKPRKTSRSKEKRPKSRKPAKNQSNTKREGLDTKRFVAERDFSKVTDTSPRPQSATNEPLHDTQLKLKVKPSHPRISRSISYALRGLPTPFRLSHAAEGGSENIKALPSMATTSLMQVSAAAPSAPRAEPVRSMELRDVDVRSTLSSDSVAEHPSKPISIAGSGPRPVSQQVSDKLEMPVRAKQYAKDGEKTSHQDKWPGSPVQSSEDEVSQDNRVSTKTPDSVPPSTLPFIRNVNASNPLKRDLNAGSTFGRWQHLYPHKPRASTVKWRSLCTPASVPLTTEDCPTASELSEGYEVREHRIQVRRVHGDLEAQLSLESLLFEMLVLRLSHGYQVIIGKTARNVAGNMLCEISVFLDPAHLPKHGDTVLMSMGNTIQKLSFTDSEYIHVTKYSKKDTEIEHPFAPMYSYDPNIRTILATTFMPRAMELRGFAEEYPWKLADNYLADGETDSESKVNKLRFWRARFVLLPVEPPTNTWRPQQTNDENEEEIHLLGIRALTQMWQKARYQSSSDRKIGLGRMGSIRRRDQNPLEIKFETLNPSELVATELDKMLALEESGEVAPTQLLPDSERLDRDTNMAKLAQAMQGERGIEIKNRRWHLRLHYNCFHGEEFTNWLWHNVKNIETRDEAVEFGNQLMKEGLFEHVNGRHNFKDGNYFYSLKQDFKTPRLDLRTSWFSGARRGDKSVPPTPLSEHPTKELPPITARSRSGSSLAYSLVPPTPLETSRAFLEKRKKTVTLMKMIRIDVDPRKRSNRPEIINLHYDRFHNPENCYHIELCWLNATSKLVDDAIVSWTSQAEKYGLKLVEVPIAEASRVPESEPFRRAHEIKLALEPPKRQGASHVLTTSSFAPQPYLNSSKHFYQKLILKKFNFVLDLEGILEFPENVDVQYSSAGLVYKHTQFVHRSGVCLAQITEEGDLLLLANRLYNARFANSKEAAHIRFDRREHHLGPGFSHRPPIPPPQTSNPSVQMQASGVIGLNLQSPRLSATPSPSPMAQVTADVFGSKSAMSTTPMAQYVTPEQIKDDLVQFCSDPARLEQFYRENGTTSSAAQHTPGGTNRRSTGGSGGGGTSSSALEPIQDANEGIPDFVLPESLTSPSTSSGGFGLNFSGLMSRRSRQSVAYESVAEMMGRSGNEGSRDRHDSGSGSASGGGEIQRVGSYGSSNNGGGGKIGSGEASGRTSGDVSGSGGHLELRVKVDTPGGNSLTIEEGMIEGMRDGIGIGSPRAKG